MSLVFVDTSCLITLERVDRLGLLPVVFSNSAAPPEVVDEFGWRPHWLTVMTVRDQRFLDTLQTQLDPGEAGVLALAREHENSIVLIDEKKARRLAQKLDLRLIGTAGVLLRAKRQGVLPTVKPVLDALVEANFRVSDRLYHEVLRLAGEHGQ